jgi:hypothetical protein
MTQKLELHVPPFSGTWALTASVAVLVSFDGSTTSSVSLWPFPVLYKDFSISFNDIRHDLCYESCLRGILFDASLLDLSTYCRLALSILKFVELNEDIFIYFLQ